MNIAASYSSGKLTVFLAGELDHHEAGGAIRAIGELIEEKMPRECVIDMSSLSFMDSSGIAVLINAGRKMRAFGGRLSVENPSEQARKVLDAAGIDRLIAVAMNN